jgi:hypothetical protein
MLTKPIHQLKVAAFVGVTLLASGCTSNPPAPSSSISVSTPPPSSSPYENKLIRRPGNTAEDSKVYVVQNGKKRWVVNASWFSSHGYKFPEEVQEIPAAQFAAIPEADPIQ